MGLSSGTGVGGCVRQCVWEVCVCEYGVSVCRFRVHLPRPCTEAWAWLWGSLLSVRVCLYAGCVPSSCICLLLELEYNQSMWCFFVFSVCLSLNVMCVCMCLCVCWGVGWEGVERCFQACVCLCLWAGV